MKKAAQALFKWVESEADLPIRVSCTAAFVTRGSLHMLADNKLALNAGWNDELLALELWELKDLDFDLELTGFDAAEIEARDPLGNL